MKICVRCEEESICKHYYCTRIIVSRRAKYTYMHIRYVYHVYSIRVQVKLFLLSLLLLSSGENNNLTLH